jgi:chromosome segregation ATPase
MDVIIQAVTDALDAVVNWQHFQGAVFVAGGTALFAGLVYGPLDGTIDAPPPESQLHKDFDEDQQQTLDDILNDVELLAPLPPAPNIPVPSIWGHPNTISYSPGNPWNQALTLRQPNAPTQASTWPFFQFLLGVVVFVVFLYKLIQQYCCKRPKLAAATDDENNAPENPVNHATQDLEVQIYAPAVIHANLASDSKNAESATSEREQKLQENLDAAQSELEKRRALDAERNAELSRARKEHSELQQRIDRLQKPLSEPGHEGSESTAPTASDDQRMRKLQGERDAARTQANERNAEMKALEDKVQRLEETIEMLKSEKREEKAAHAKIEGELNGSFQDNCRLKDGSNALAAKNVALQAKVGNASDLEPPHYYPEALTLHEARREINRLKDQVLSAEGRLRQTERKARTIKQLEDELDKAVAGNPIYAEVHSVFKERDLYKRQLDWIKERGSEEVKKSELDNNEKTQKISKLEDDKDNLKIDLREAEGLRKEAESKVQSGAQSDNKASTESSEENEVLQAKLDSALAESEDLDQMYSLLAVEKSDLETQVATLHERISTLQTQNSASSGADRQRRIDEASAQVRRLTNEAAASHRRLEEVEAHNRVLEDTNKKLREESDKTNDDLEDCNLARRELPTREQHNSLQERLAAVEEENEEMKKQCMTCNCGKSKQTKEGDGGQAARAAEADQATNMASDLQRQLDDTKRRLGDSESSRATLQQQNEQLQKNLDEMSRSLDDCNSTREKLIEQTPKLPVGEGLTVDGLKKGNRMLKSQLDDQIELASQANERNVQLKNQNDRLAAEKSDVQAQNSRLQQQLGMAKKGAPKNYRDANIQTDADAMDTTHTMQLRQCEEGRKRDSEELESGRKANEALQKQVKDLQEQDASLTAAYKEIYGFAENQTTALNETMTALNEALDREEQAQDELRMAEQENGELHQRVKQLETLPDTLQDQCNYVNAELETVREQLAATEGELKECKTKQKREVGDSRYAKALAQQNADLRLQLEQLTATRPHAVTPESAADKGLEEDKQNLEETKEGNQPQDEKKEDDKPVEQVEKKAEVGAEEKTAEKQADEQIEKEADEELEGASENVSTVSPQTTSDPEVKIAGSARQDSTPVTEAQAPAETSDKSLSTVEALEDTDASPAPGQDNVSPSQSKTEAISDGQNPQIPSQKPTGGPIETSESGSKEAVPLPASTNRDSAEKNATTASEETHKPSSNTSP